MSDFVPVAAYDSLPGDGLGVAAEIAGRRVALFRDGNEVFAALDLCSHRDVPLSGGRCHGGRIVCPAHGAAFDARTGEALTPPACGPIAVLACRVVGGRVEVAAG